MSGSLDVLSLGDEDAAKMLAAGVYLGSPTCDYQMESYRFKKSHSGNIINLRKTWEKLLLAARAIVAIENPADVCVLSAKPFGQRAVLKYAAYTGATPIAGRYTPGAFTNQIQAAFREPRLLIVTDPYLDSQPIIEASYVNIPVIAFCNMDSPLRLVDIAIPCNNKASHAIGLMWWLLAREVLFLRGNITKKDKWEVKVDLFFYRNPDEVEKEEQARQELPAVQPKIPDMPAASDDWATPAIMNTNDWSTDTAAVAPVAPAAADSFRPAGAAVPAAKLDWADEVDALQSTTNDWSTATSTNWD